MGDGRSKKECAYAMNIVHERSKKEMCKAKRNVQKTSGNLRIAVAGYNQPNVEGAPKHMKDEGYIVGGPESDVFRPKKNRWVKEVGMLKLLVKKNKPFGWKHSPFIKK